jgi:ribosomal protein S18 acetylase RimI-like enzyme
MSHQRSIVPVPDQARAVATLVSAFANDPVERWLWPVDGDYTTHFAELVVAMGGAAFATQTAWQWDEFAAVALWFAPGVEADGDSIVRVLTETIAPEKRDDTMAVVNALDATHPRFPHWYLPWFGVDVTAQGRGLGSRLMTSCLETVDESHLPAYLETPNPRNISFYERHGFEITGDVHAGDCPPVTFMLRPAN